MQYLCFPYDHVKLRVLGRFQEHDVGKRILVVDDEPQIRRIMRAVLVAKRYEVADAECGEDALKLIRSAKYDVGSENSDPFHSGNSEPSGESRKG
jgi:hypothetical protein